MVQKKFFESIKMTRWMKILQTPIGISMLAIQSSWPHYRPLYKANEPYKSTLLKST